jgi:hypothetical protein
MIVTSYTVSLWNDVAGLRVTARIKLYNKEDKIAELIFYDPSTTTEVPDNQSEPRIMYIPKDRYPWHLDLLRHESPVSLFVKKPGQLVIGNPSLHTGSEPVGEGE